VQIQFISRQPLQTVLFPLLIFNLILPSVILILFPYNLHRAFLSHPPAHLWAQPKRPVRSHAYDDPIYVSNRSHFLSSQYVHSRRLWDLINYHKDVNTSTKQDLLHLSFLLEEQIQNIISLNSILKSHPTTFSPTRDPFEFIIQFYLQPELSLKTVRHSPISFHQQIINPPIKSAPLPSNRFAAFEDIDTNMPDMEIDLNIAQPIPQNCVPVIPKQKWHSDTSVTELSDKLFNHLKQRQEIAKEAGELESDAPIYEDPTSPTILTPPLSQRIRFNLICHRGTISDIPIGKSFKSFLTTMCNADSSLIVLPYQSAKQHYSS